MLKRLGVGNGFVLLALFAKHAAAQAPASSAASPPPSASAEAPLEDTPRHFHKPLFPWVALRGSYGLGTSGDGLAERVAAAFSIWPSRLFGATAEYQYAVDAGLRGGGPIGLYSVDRRLMLLSAGPALRIPFHHRYYAQTDLLFGAGHGSAFRGTSLERRYSGLAVSAVEGVYWHPAIFELGPCLELTLYDKVLLGTVSLAFGFAW